MPPKRKATSTPAEESPNKRRTRSDGLPLADTQPAPRKSIHVERTVPTTLHKRTTTYGRKRGLLLKEDESVDSLKENGDYMKEYNEDGDDEDSSDDELILSPSKLVTADDTKVVSPSTPSTAKRAARVIRSSQRNDDTPSRRQPKRGQGNREDDATSSLAKKGKSTPHISKVPLTFEEQDIDFSRITSLSKVQAALTRTPRRTSPRKSVNQSSLFTPPSSTQTSVSAAGPRSTVNTTSHTEDLLNLSNNPMPSPTKDANTPRRVTRNTPRAQRYEMNDEGTNIPSPTSSPTKANTTRRLTRKTPRTQRPQRETPDDGAHPPSPPKETNTTQRATRNTPRTQQHPKREMTDDGEESPSSPTKRQKTLGKRKKVAPLPRMSPTPRLDAGTDISASSPIFSTRASELHESPTAPTSRPASPVNEGPKTPQLSPSRRNKFTLSSPIRLPHKIPAHLHSCLDTQKRDICRILQRPPDITDPGDASDEEETPTNTVAHQQLANLLNGTITRGEGNSCLILGPRGSGKTRIVEQCISDLSKENPLIIRLSGWTQHSDRLAMREIAYQLGQQTGTSFLSHIDEDSSDLEVDDDANPFLDAPASTKISLPPSSHLPALISVLPTLARPTIVVLDGFDLFALHPRQSLLYCLLDTAQSCRATAGSKGLAVVGITSRIDTITILEKRVKSRFSGRMFRCAPPRKVRDWERLVKSILCPVNHNTPRGEDGHGDVAEWKVLWDSAVDKFMADRTVQTTLSETFSVTQDVRMLNRMLLATALHLSPAAPFPSSSQFVSAAVTQRARPHFPFLHALPYPNICLLIASIHADTAGQPNFTFEMLYEHFRDQVRASTSAPVQVNGGSIGMVRCSRQVLMTAFEDLISTKVLISTTALVPSMAKEFVKYRSVLGRDEVKKAVDKMGQVNLRKWLTKAQ